MKKLTVEKLTVDEIFNLLRKETHGRFFSVTYERRTDGLRQRAGDLRTMLCRVAGTMRKYKRGIVPTARRDREDFRLAVLTVWDIQQYQQNRQHGMDQETAGRNAYRRIDVAGIRHCSVLDDSDLPPTIRMEFHNIQNRFRLANMPESVT